MKCDNFLHYCVDSICVHCYCTECPLSCTKNKISLCGKISTSEHRLKLINVLKIELTKNEYLRSAYNKSRSQYKYLLTEDAIEYD